MKNITSIRSRFCTASGQPAQAAAAKIAILLLFVVGMLGMACQKEKIETIPSNETALTKPIAASDRCPVFVTNVKSNSVSLAWIEIHGAVQYQIAVQSIGGHLPKTQNCDETARTATIKGLLSDTEYAVTLSAISPEGKRIISITHYFRTERAISLSTKATVAKEHLLDK